MCDKKQDKCDYCKNKDKFVVIEKPHKCCGKCKTKTEQTVNNTESREGKDNNV